MQITLTCTFNLKCPYLNRLQQISIDYMEVPMCGTTQQCYKKGDYSCDEMDNCPFPSKDKYGRCPVYLNAPSRPPR
jgi:hypothetical protein